MLQIITEKFFPPGERYETLHRAIFYKIIALCVVRRSSRP
jgi:hypothetical protein